MPELFSIQEIETGLTKKKVTSSSRTVGIPPKVTPWSTVLPRAVL